MAYYPLRMGAVCVVTRSIMSPSPHWCRWRWVAAAANCSIYSAPDYIVQEEDLSQHPATTDKSVFNI